MPKLKTKKKAAKRFRITKHGKVLTRASGRRHLLVDKAHKAKRQMRRVMQIESAMARNIKRQLPYA